ncbi:MAG: hypothetical protein ABIP29_05355 [Candidatus Eisenbacteria bacterium]
MTILRSTLGKLWASPNTVLGLVLGVVAVMLGARARIGDNAIEFLDQPFVDLIERSAVTLGNTIHYAPGRDPDQAIRRYDRSATVRLGDHERAHTDQYERWGPFFLLAYAISWLPFVPPAGSRFEHAADDAAERRGCREREAGGGSGSGVT